MKKTLATIALSVLGIIAIITIGPYISDIAYDIGRDYRAGEAEKKYGGEAIYDKYGLLCTTTTIRESDNTCPLDLPR